MKLDSIVCRVLCLCLQLLIDDWFYCGLKSIQFNQKKANTFDTQHLFFKGKLFEIKVFNLFNFNAIAKSLFYSNSLSASIKSLITPHKSALGTPAISDMEPRTIDHGRCHKPTAASSWPNVQLG